MSLTGANIQTFVGRITGDTSADGLQMVLDILQGVLEEIYDFHPWPWRRKHAELVTQAPYTTGTITAAAGATTIEGAGTTWTDISGYASTDDPFFLIVGHEIHRIESFTDLDTLVLKTGLAVAASAATYGIYRPWVNVTSGVSEVLDVLCYPYGPLRDWPLKQLLREFLVASTGSVPYAYGQVEDGASKVVRIGVYPFMTEAKHLSYTYMASAPDISAGSTDLGCPDSFRSCVVAGVLGEWYRTYHDRQDLAQANEVTFGRKLALLKNASKVHGGPYTRKPWGRPYTPRTGFYITQEVEL